MKTKSEQNGMKAGFASACLTPPAGIEMEGLARPEPSTGIHDDLFVRALSLRQGETRLLILSYDLLFFDQQTVDRMKGAVGRALDLSPWEIFMNFTHTHAGPRLTEWHYEGRPCPHYLNKIETASVQAARESEQALGAVTLSAGETTSTLPVSRRKIDEQGVAQWLPAFEQPVYDGLPYCFLKDGEGRVVSILFSVSCHPSMIHTGEISAEFPGAAVRSLNERFSTAGSIFLQGAAGDAKPRPSAREGRWRSCTWEAMEAVGKEIAEVIAGDVCNQIPIENPELRSVLKDVPWLLDKAPSKAGLQEIETDGENSFRKSWAKDMLQQLALDGHLPEEVLLSCHIVEFAPNLRFVGIAGEVMARLGLRVKACFPEGITFVLGYTNGTKVYMPVSEELPEGGYEVKSFWEYHLPAPCRHGAEVPLLNYLADYGSSNGKANTNQVTRQA